MEDHHDTRRKPQLEDGTPSHVPNGEDPRLVEFAEKLEGARNVIAILLTDIENITLHQNPSIEAEWQVKVGAWENSLLEAQISMRRAKRKLAIARASVNHGETIDETAIDLQLESEFARWQNQLDLATKTYQHALAVRSSTIKIKPEKSQALKDVFRILAKRLHPDINTSQDENMRMMLFLAQNAYKQADLEMLKSLEVSTRSMESTLRMPKSVDEAEVELALTMAHVGVLEERKRSLVNSKPYCLLKLLRDEAWMEDHIGKIKAEIEACKEAESIYRARFEQHREEDGAHAL